MRSAKIRGLISMLYRGGSQEAQDYAEKKLQEMGITLSELYEALKMDGQSVEAFAIEGYARLSAPLHSHDFCEILYCRSGGGAEYLVGGKRYSLQNGDVILVPPETSHAIFYPSEGGNGFYGYSLWISREFFDLLQSRFPYLRDRQPLSEHRVRTQGTIWSRLEDQFRLAAGEAQIRTPGWEMALEGYTVSLMANLIRAIETHSLPIVPQGEKKQLLEQILAYVEGTLHERLTLEEVASRFWVSQSTVAHLFTKKLGISFYQYVLQRRLAEAKSLILEGIPIEQVSARVGFGDYSAFYRAFKREYKVSPKQFRQMNGECKMQNAE